MDRPAGMTVRLVEEENMSDMKDLGRRDFLKKSLAGLAVASVPPIVKAAEVKHGEPGPKPVIRTLGRTGLKVPVVSMGVMNADNPGLVQAALDSGIRLLDTAHVYQRGRNEEMIGQVLKGRPRDSFMVATKVIGPDRDPSLIKLGPKELKAAFLEKFDLSLKRLGLDHVEIFYLHNNEKREHVLNTAIMEAMVEAKRSGKARYIGVTTHANEPEVIRAAMEAKIYDVILTSYNFRQDHREEVGRAIAEAAAAGIGIVAMKTQAGAYWDRERTKPINMKAALKWVLQNPDVTTAIPGFTSFDQISTDISVMTDLKLTPEEINDLRLDQRAGGLYCQQCSHCVPGCPQALPIPSLMRGYMYAYGYRNIGKAQELVSSLGLPDDPCAGCSSCSAKCVKGFDVAGRIKDIIRLKSVPGDFFA